MTSLAHDRPAAMGAPDLEAAARRIAALARNDLPAAERESDATLAASGFARAGEAGELLALAREIGLLAGFRERAVQFLTTKTRPWPGTGYDRAADDPHVLRRFGRFVSFAHALDELFEIALPLVVVGSAEARDELAAARRLSARIGGEISDVIALLGAGATGEGHGFHRFWQDFHVHLLAHPSPPLRVRPAGA